MKTDLQVVREIADATGLTTDYLSLLFDGLSIHFLYKVAGNAAVLPSTMKSMDSPNVRRSFKAPPMDG